MSDTALDAMDEYLADTAYSYYTDEELAESPAQRKARLAAKATPKGVCPKCSKRIGKGIAFHVKACNG